MSGPANSATATALWQMGATELAEAIRTRQASSVDTAGRFRLRQAWTGAAR
jgi:hypothetical protein